MFSIADNPPTLSHCKQVAGFTWDRKYHLQPQEVVSVPDMIRTDQAQKNLFSKGDSDPRAPIQEEDVRSEEEQYVTGLMWSLSLL